MVDERRDFTIAPDYRLTVYSVFIQSAMYILSDPGGLKLPLGARTPPEKWSPLPKWCVDWAVPPSDAERLRLQCLGLYTVDGGRPPTTVTLHDSRLGRLLKLQALLINEVVSVEQNSPPKEGLSRLQVSAINGAAKLKTQQGHDNYKVCRHICADIVHCEENKSTDERGSYRRAKDSDEEAFHYFYETKQSR